LFNTHISQRFTKKLADGLHTMRFRIRVTDQTHHNPNSIKSRLAPSAVDEPVHKEEFTAQDVSKKFTP